MPGVKGLSGGRNAKTVEELKAAGTFKPCRHDGIENPERPEGEPAPPKALEGDAAEEWARMVETLRLTKTISTVDAHALYQHCRLFTETEELVAEKAEARAGVNRLLESQGDIEKADLLPFFIELGKMTKLAASYDTKIRGNRLAIIKSLQEFGLTPAARGRVKSTSQKSDEQPKSPLAQLQAQARGLRAVK